MGLPVTSAGEPREDEQVLPEGRGNSSPPRPGTPKPTVRQRMQVALKGPAGPSRYELCAHHLLQLRFSLAQRCVVGNSINDSDRPSLRDADARVFPSRRAANPVGRSLVLGCLQGGAAQAPGPSCVCSPSPLGSWGGAGMKGTNRAGHSPRVHS